MEVIDPLPLSWDHGVVRELLYLGVGGDRNVTKAASDWLSVCVDSSQ